MKSSHAIIVSALFHTSTSSPTPVGLQYAASTVTGIDLQLPPNAFGSAIEGTGVDRNGDMFAADFRADGSPPSFSYAEFFSTISGTAGILSGQNPIFTALNNTLAPPLLSGSRFLLDGRILLADAQNKRVLAVDPVAKDVNTFCADQRMLQPNDIALSTIRDTIIYLSGQNFTANTIAGVSGDLWTCDGGLATQFSPEILATAGIHRTNGIETSPDGKFLYLSSAKNVNDTVVQNRIYRFTLDPNTGRILNQIPTLFFDFTDSEATDIDGMRTDTDGNLYVTRNGDGKIVKLSPYGKLELTIILPNMGGPSNLEFGGPKGSTLFAIGKCASNNTIGCAAYFETDAVGKAFSTLQECY